MSSETDLELRSELTGEMDSANDSSTADEVADSKSSEKGVGGEKKNTEEEEEEEGDGGALSDDEDGDAEDIYEVETILKTRIYRGKRQFFIRWKNYDASHDTWEPQENLGGAQKMIDDFNAREGISKQQDVKNGTGRPARGARGRGGSSQPAASSPSAGGRKRGTSTRQPPSKPKPDYAGKDDEGEEDEDAEVGGDESDRDDEFAPTQKKKKGAAKSADKKELSSSGRAIRLVRGNATSSAGTAKPQNSIGTIVAKRLTYQKDHIPRWIDEGGSSDDESEDKDIIAAALKAATTNTATPASAAAEKPSTRISHEKESTPPAPQSGKANLSSMLRQAAETSGSADTQLPNGDAGRGGSKAAEKQAALQNGLTNNTAANKTKGKNTSSQFSFVGLVRDKKTGEILYVSHDEKSDQRRVLTESEAVEENPVGLAEFMRSQVRFLPNGDTEIAATEANID